VKGVDFMGILTVITTAATVGLGCGTCCSPVISAFLSTYVVSHADGVKNGVLSFLSFFLGKLLSVSCLCMIAALLGKQFIGSDGNVGPVNLRLVAQIIMSGIGMVMAVKWIIENRQQKSENNCRGCGKSKKQISSGFLPMLAAGITYGFTPCVPLLMMIGYSFTLSVILAGVTGISFGIASAAIPILLLVIISGALSKRLMWELPQYLKWFQLASYLILVIMPFAVGLDTP
jgi:hypothetical protein